MDDNNIIELNRPQILLHLINAGKTYALWGRGTGKTNGGLGPRIMHLFNKMPRAQIGLVTPSYEMAFKQILNNITGFWQNDMGLIEGQDYVIGKKPPDDWEKPIIPVLEHKYVISFSNGSVMPILSLKVQGSANGFNMQALVGDEGKFFDEKKLKEIIRAVRGGYKQFGHLAEFQSQWYFSDKYDGDIEWMLNKRKLQNWDKIKAVIKIQLEINRLIEEDDEANTARIIKLEQILTDARKSLVYVSEASAEENRKILGDKYFADQKEISTTNEYNIAINNNDPDKVENSFYPDMAEQHYYNVSNDIDSNKPLMLAADYQWRISPICVAQYGTLPGSNKQSLNFVYSTYALHPLGLTDAIDQFCNRFKNHINKTVYYLFDKTAVGKSPTVKPFYQVVQERLVYNGWKVMLINMGETPKHDDKFKMISRHLKAESKKPQIRINGLRNEDLIRSINLSPAIQFYGKTSKDKSSEKNLSIPAVKTTHFSDVFDMIVYACIELELVEVQQNYSPGILMM